jgi:hypothetical protein
MRFHYDDYVAIRDLMTELQENENPEDRLNPQEVRTLNKASEIIARMEKKRAREDAGVIPKTKFVYRRGHRVKVLAVARRAR